MRSDIWSCVGWRLYFRVLMVLFELIFKWIILCQVPFADLHEASEALIKALLIRAKYMAASQQSFPITTSRFLRNVCEVVPEYISETEGIVHQKRETIQGELKLLIIPTRGKWKLKRFVETLNFSLKDVWKTFRWKTFDVERRETLKRFVEKLKSSFHFFTCRHFSFLSVFPTSKCHCFVKLVRRQKKAPYNVTVCWSGLLNI